ncbi:MAG: hypothetical protein AAF291_06440 [Pseudomonadota bacterium]
MNNEPERKEDSSPQKSIFTSTDGYISEDGVLNAPANPVDAFWKQVECDARDWNSELRGYDTLVSNAADATREDLRRTLGWLEASLGLRDRTSAVAACRYLNAMPEPLLASDYPRLLNIFNSRKVGMVWPASIDPKKADLPRGPIPVFGIEAGFGLLRHAPELYRKLAMFGPEMEEILIALVEEAVHHGVSLPPDLVTLAKSRSDRPKP